ncbi:MAG: HAD-IA family hydrolase [Rubrivivax sp.]|nr:HAD-IA family hydrolase [Rubrivivax sp.]
MKRTSPPVWLFDLDDTLHDATTASMPQLRESFGRYIEQHLRLTREESDALRSRYWQRYGATLLGLVRHHGVKAAHFLHETHLLPGLEQRVRGHRHDLAALARLPGRRYILTNAPAAYAKRVLGVLGIDHLFEGLFAIEDMHMFGQLRPKPDARMLRRLVARLRVMPSQCVLVEDTLVHQKAARGLGMHTVWMQRWLPGKKRRHAGRPGYVTHRVRSLAQLRVPTERTNAAD